MTDPRPSPVRLVAAARQIGPLVPEQAAVFDLTLLNDGADSWTGVWLEGDWSTPVLRILDPTGTVLGSYTRWNAKQRLGKDVNTFRPGAPRLVTLGPAERKSTFVNLWKYTGQLKSGRYRFDAIHRVGKTGLQFVSNQVPFDIVPARVTAVALGYHSSARFNTVLAWLALPAEHTGSGRLLIRVSGVHGHRTLQTGANAFGSYPVAARLSCGRIPDGVRNSVLGWVAVVTETAVDLIRHNLGYPELQGGPYPHALNHPQPVPGFPDRGRAVFLATGGSTNGSALVGMILDPNPPATSEGEELEEAAGPQDLTTTNWTVPLLAEPKLTACAFGSDGPITLILIADDGKQATISRLDVEETGNVATAETVVYTTPHQVLAAVADMRHDTPLSFLVLIAERDRPNRLGLLRLRVDGQTQDPCSWGVIPESVVPETPDRVATRDTAPMPGWPVSPDETHRPLYATSISLEVDASGNPWMALVDEHGGFHGGELKEGLEELRTSGTDSPASFPHVAALKLGVGVSCFTGEGVLFHTGHAGHSH